MEKVMAVESPLVPIMTVRPYQLLCAIWMMCGLCPHRVPGLNACANLQGGGGLSNEKRDLDVLQRLGLHYGCVMKAGDRYRLIFAPIASSMETCPRDGNPSTSPWWDRSCGDSNPTTRHGLDEIGRAEFKDGF